jgi:hypothetical protein
MVYSASLPLSFTIKNSTAPLNKGKIKGDKNSESKNKSENK